MARKYPKRFYNEEIINVAAEQMQHDFRKLFPDLDASQWPIIDKNILEWFEGENYELEPTHDFWNFFGGFARGLKLKSLLSWLTADNVTWGKENVKLKDIIITWDFPGLEFMDKAPFTAFDVIKKLNKPQMKDYKTKMRHDSDYRSGRFAPRDQFRIMLFHDPRGDTIDKLSGYYILEGNRRVIKAILKDDDYIPAYVGRFTDPSETWPENYWFRTGILRDLIFLAIHYDKNQDNQSFDIVRKFYQLLVRDFENIRIATYDISFKNFEKSDRLSHDIIHKDIMK